MGFEAFRRKLEAAEYFSSILASRIPKSICKIYLFGSVAKKKFSVESDVDLLIVLDKLSEEDLDMVAEAAFEASMKTGEPIETVTMSILEFHSKASTPFLHEVLNYGVKLYDGGEAPAINSLLHLADEYYSYALDAFKDGKYRLTIDTGYNAAELIVKALIILKNQPLAPSHGGIIQQFGRLYVTTGIVDKEIGKKLYRALDLRNKARYDATYIATEEEASIILKLVEKLKDIAKTVVK